MEWGFAAFLLLGLVAVGASSYLQYRRFLDEVAGLRAAYAGHDQKYLVSGRGKHSLRGVIVLLVVDSDNEEILEARLMRGATVFARFRDWPRLLGPLVTVEFRESDATIRRALGEAIAQFRRLVEPGSLENRPAFRRKRPKGGG